MTEVKADGNQVNGRSESADRKKYVKPDFRSERIFETSAVACGKIPGTSDTCNSFPRSS